MKIVSKIIIAERIILTSDWHAGASSMSRECVSRIVERARTRRVPWIGLGDLLDCIVPGDRRFDIDDHGGLAFCGAWAWARDQIHNVSRYCVGLLEGNHEAMLSRTIGSVTRLLCSMCSVPYLSQTTFFTVRAPRAKKNVRVFAAHGTLSFTSRAGLPERRAVNRQLRLREYLMQFDADVKAVGHGHRMIVDSPRYSDVITPRATDIVRVRRLYLPSWSVMVPSAMRVYGTYASYAEAALTEAADLGWCELCLGRAGCESIEYYDETGRLAQTWTPQEV